ncbi:coiled-coil domain-containing protein 186-like isoform X2 [Portunus trituberculatus]|uniref:coiled-coil domain-containing protein 186-like isoform X2 n=1 Tax=Portunus trituberculatus TaxID=210409 RepID=UPI001E1CE6E2|nr:coiled-coil domain-containing protein 186-like isoform X2 [Portunus trituberculatus]
MDINQSSCSSEQPTFKQTQLQECPDSTRQIIGDDSREITANTDCLVNESRHSIEISDSSTDKTSFRGSSDVINENNSSVHDKDDVALNSEDSFGDECSLSHGDGSCNPLGTTVLQDDSVVEFSLTTEKGPDTNHEMELVLAHIVGSDHENIPSQSVKMPEPPEHKGENEDETQQIPAKFEEEETEETLMKIKAKEQSNSSQFQNEISTLLSDTSALCSPTSDVEVGTVDFSSTPKENLMRMVSDLLNECDWLKKEKARLENEVDCLEADNSSLAYMAQIEALEKSLAQAQADACSWEQKLQQAEQNYMAENVKIRTDLTTRLERITKQYEAANKDKEAMVIKYATSEREVIIARKQKEALEKRMKDMEKERENLLSKNKMLISERARICQTLDAKVQKNNAYQREIDRLKEEINSKDIKIKWAQAKLKSEMEAYQECQGKLDRALTKITKHEEELRTIKEEAENTVQAAKEDENSRANVLDMQLKEEKARLIMERQVNEDRGSAFTKITAELEELKHKHQALEEEATSLRTKLTSREIEQDEMEKLFSCLRAEVTTARQEASDLSHQLSNSAHLQQQLTREKEQLERAIEEVDRLQSTNNELENELLACRQKEAELLAFTQKLSDKNVHIQSQYSALQSKTQLTEIEHEELKAEVEELKLQKSKLKAELAKESQKHNIKLESLNQQLTEKTEEAKKLTVKASDLENEVQVLNRKHNNALKDITREMQKLRRRLDLQENGSSGGNESISGGVSSGRSSQSVTPHDNLSQGSRASSNTSLNTLEYHNDTSSQTQDHLPPLNDPMVTQQLLVDRIIKLQKSAAKRAEKMEFLEEHNAQLVGELKKKSRIIHHYIMREEAGALANSASDTSKSSNAATRIPGSKKQAELMRHGGIMASVYGSAPRDGTMTLELSLEINRKLQAVLEDTLLKNITLKVNRGYTLRGLPIFLAAPRT